MNPEQIEYLSSLKRGCAAVYAEGDNKPKCVKLPLIKSFYEKERGEVIDEVRRKVHDIASGYDELIQHHAACSYCEKRCKYFDSVRKYIDSKIAVSKVLEKWEQREYAPAALVSFMNSGLMQGIARENDFVSRCCIGYILQQNSDLNDGQRQNILADYLRYINQL